jgi:hypothetical protein
MRFQRGDVRAPLLRLFLAVRRQLPAPLSNKLANEHPRCRRTRETREAMFGVSFPEPVGGNLGVVAEALLALPQRRLAVFAVGDVALDYKRGLYVLRSRAKRRVAHGEIAPGGRLGRPIEQDLFTSETAVQIRLEGALETVHSEEFGDVHADDFARPACPIAAHRPDWRVGIGNLFPRCKRRPARFRRTVRSSSRPACAR